MELYSFFLSPIFYISGILVTLLFCALAVFIESKPPRLTKSNVTYGDIVVFILLAALSWIGLAFAAIICMVNNTNWCNKTVFRL